MEQSGIDAAIQELEQDVKRVQEAITLLKKIQLQRVSHGNTARPRRQLSVKARRRISEAAKRRWAAARARGESKGARG